MNKEQLFQIAKIIDNEFVGKEKTFTADRAGCLYWYLTTNICDYASFIRVYETNNKISTIQVLGDYTDGWQDIMPETWGKVMKYLKTINVVIASTNE